MNGPAGELIAIDFPSLTNANKVEYFRPEKANSLDNVSLICR